jgi:hypothetical protein
MEPTTAAMLLALASYNDAIPAARSAIYLNHCVDIGNLTPKQRVNPATLKAFAAADYAKVSLALLVVYNSTEGTDGQLELVQRTFCKGISILNADRK